MLEIKDYKKKILSVEFAKINYRKFSHVLTTSGYFKPRQPEDILYGTPCVFLDGSWQSLYSSYLNAFMDTYGANIAQQIWDSFSDDEVIKLIKNMEKQLGFNRTAIVLETNKPKTINCFKVKVEV